MKPCFENDQSNLEEYLCENLCDKNTHYCRVSDDPECIQKECQCDNGVGAVGVECPENGASKCANCTSGFELDGSSCKAAGEKKQLPGNFEATFQASTDPVGCGFQLVRRVRGYDRWHTATDKLAGTSVYGVFTEDVESDSSFSRKYDHLDFDQFMFAFGDFSKWVILTKEQIGGPAFGGYMYVGEYRDVVASSSGKNVAQQMQRNQPSDPWISVDRHTGTDIVYGEGGDGHHQVTKQQHKGANVFIRNTALC